MTTQWTYSLMDPHFGCKPQWLCILWTQPVVRAHRFFLASEVSSCGHLQGLCSPGLLLLHFRWPQNGYRTKLQCQVFTENVEKGSGNLLVGTWNCNHLHTSSRSSPVSALVEVQRLAAAQLSTARAEPIKMAIRWRGEAKVVYWSNSLKNSAAARKEL